MTRENSVRNLAVATLAVATAVFFLGCGDASVEAVYPIERAREGFARHVWSRIVGLVKSSEASAENVRLRREVALAAMTFGDIERLEAENARLRKALGYGEHKLAEWIPAEVLSEGGAAAARAETLRVAAGSLVGICEGAVVAAPDGLIGIVSGVTPHTSEVLTVADANVRVACEIEGGDGVRCYGILSGGSREQLVVKYLVHAEKVAVRSRVVTSGRGGVFPRGIEIGTVVGVVRGLNGDVEAVEVVPSVDFESVEDVFIRHEG